MFDLKKARKKCRLSQQALGKLALVGRFKISQHELGYIELTKEEVARIKTALIANRGASRVTNKKIKSEQTC